MSHSLPTGFTLLRQALTIMLSFGVLTDKKLGVEEKTRQSKCGEINEGAYMWTRLFADLIGRILQRIDIIRLGVIMIVSCYRHNWRRGKSEHGVREITTEFSLVDS